MGNIFQYFKGREETDGHKKGTSKGALERYCGITGSGGIQELVEVSFGEDGDGGDFFGVIDFGASIIACEEVGYLFGDAGADFAASVFDQGFEVAAFGGEGASDDKGEPGELLGGRGSDEGGEFDVGKDGIDFRDEVFAVQGVIDGGSGSGTDIGDGEDFVVGSVEECVPGAEGICEVLGGIGSNLGDAEGVDEACEGGVGGVLECFDGFDEFGDRGLTESGQGCECCLVLRNTDDVRKGVEETSVVEGLDGGVAEVSDIHGGAGAEVSDGIEALRGAGETASAEEVGANFAVLELFVFEG